jgi:hypothetical protein
MFANAIAIAKENGCSSLPESASAIAIVLPTPKTTSVILLRPNVSNTLYILSIDDVY